MITELLREAAALMRARAEAATDSREWNVDVLVVGNFHEEEDAVHIASWNPAVALAVADWLEHQADFHDELRKHGARGLDPDGIGAFTVARGYLGRDDVDKYGGGS